MMVGDMDMGQEDKQVKDMYFKCIDAHRCVLVVSCNIRNQFIFKNISKNEVNKLSDCYQLILFKPSLLYLVQFYCHAANFSLLYHYYYVAVLPVEAVFCHFVLFCKNEMKLKNIRRLYTISVVVQNNVRSYGFTGNLISMEYYMEYGIWKRIQVSRQGGAYGTLICKFLPLNYTKFYIRCSLVYFFGRLDYIC